MFDKVVQRFSDSYRLINGNRVRGKLGDVDFNSSDNTDLLTPRKILTTSDKTLLKAGDLLNDGVGGVYLVAERNTLPRNSMRIWWLIETTGQYSHTRREVEIDPVTNLERETPDKPLGDVYAQVEPLKIERDTLRVDQQVMQIITGRELKVGDKLGTLRVSAVQKLSGVYVAEGSA